MDKFKRALQPVTEKNFEQNNSKKNAQMNPTKNYIIFNKNKQSNLDLKKHPSVFFFRSLET